jgi:hypothetical protein
MSKPTTILKTIKMLPQPDDNTCGPTSLHAVYNYYDKNIALSDVIKNVTFLKRGGTLGVYLALDALKMGMKATIYTFNLRMFDPTWMTLDSKGLIKKLKEQLQYKRSRHFREVSLAYIRFLRRGGIIKMENLDTRLIKTLLHDGRPILTGLSATYLYQSQREYSMNDKSIYDDLRGQPMGHFVVIIHQTRRGNFQIADPYIGNPISSDNYYEVDSSRLINAILLGSVTYDANLIIIEQQA